MSWSGKREVHANQQLNIVTADSRHTARGQANSPWTGLDVCFQTENEKELSKKKEQPADEGNEQNRREMPAGKGWDEREREKRE